MHDKMPPGITLVQAENLEVWLLDIQVLDDNPIYKGETYRLKFNFSRNYPIEVRFLGPCPKTILDSC
jgi:ubiquitin-conjugating enzyme E2 W